MRLTKTHTELTLKQWQSLNHILTLTLIKERKQTVSMVNQ